MNDYSARTVGSTARATGFLSTGNQQKLCYSQKVFEKKRRFTRLVGALDTFMPAVSNLALSSRIALLS